MDKREYLIILYDYYESLLTNIQRSYFEDYYFNNYSLGEIGDNYNISRNAIHKNLKNIEQKLNYYESKLHLYDKSIKIDELLRNINDKELINKIKELY